MEVPTQPRDAPLPAHALHTALYVWDGTDARPFPRRRAPGVRVRVQCSLGRPRAAPPSSAAALPHGRQGCAPTVLCRPPALCELYSRRARQKGLDMTSRQETRAACSAPAPLLLSPNTSAAAAPSAHAARSMDTRPGAGHEPAAAEAGPPDAAADGFQRELLRLQRLSMLPWPAAAAEAPRQVLDSSPPASECGCRARCGRGARLITAPSPVHAESVRSTAVAVVCCMRASG